MLRFRAMSAEGPAGAFEPGPVNRTEVDGVPVFWSDIPMPRMGALVFGVGRSHERAATGGITHLVEHVALAPLTQQEYGHNGFVAGPRTVFHAAGTDEELAAYFGTVTRSIAEPPLGQLGMHRRILRQEAKDRQTGIAGHLAWLRFGNAGHGLAATDELGLGWLGADVVRDWARSRFTREAAAMWFSGPPPAGLRIELPSGAGSHAIPLTPVPAVGFPAYLSWQPARVSMSYLSERSAATMAALESVARRAREVLRFERGLVYDVLTDYERLDATTAQCTLSTDCQADQVPVVRLQMLRALDEVANGGLTDDDVRRAVRGFRDSRKFPQAHVGFLDGLAFDHVVGAKPETIESLTAEYESLDGVAAGELLRRSLDTLLVCSPGDPPGDRQFSVYDGWSVDAVEGRRFVPAGRRVGGVRLPTRGPEPTLTVGADGVTWRSAEGNCLTVRYADCVAYRHWQGDIRELWGADGFRVRVQPTAWHNGAEAVRLMDAAVPPEVVVCDEHGVGAYEDPEDHRGDPGTTG
jgi:hypothetical protein